MKFLLCFLIAGMLIKPTKAQTEIGITTNKTTSLIFPFPIKYVDRGTQAVLAQQVKGAPAILLVKAGSKGFAETNLSVITEDGSLYSFTVCYDDNPSFLVHHLPVQLKAGIASYANAVIDNPKSIRGIKNEKWEVKAEIKGIYIKDDVMYYQLSLENQGPINFNIELLRFFIVDKKKAKRTAVQELECKPLYIAGNTTEVKARSISTIVVALEKFTIPDGKFLSVQIMEKNGGRHLTMKVPNRKLMQAITLPDLK